MSPFHSTKHFLNHRNARSINKYFEIANTSSPNIHCMKKQTKVKPIGCLQIMNLDAQLRYSDIQRLANI